MRYKLYNFQRGGNLINIDPNYENIFINSDIPIPKFTYPINETNKQRYLDEIDKKCQDENTKIGIKEVINNMVHISFNNFIKSINYCIKQFEANIKRDYILFVPSGPYRSNYWCSQIVYHLLDKKPIKILGIDDLFYSSKETDTIEDIDKKNIINNNNFQEIYEKYDILLCDDGIYSGQQMNSNVYRINSKMNLFTKTNKKINVHIICPYISNMGLGKLENKDYGVVTSILYYKEIIKNVQELKYKYPNDGMFDTIQNKHLLYFDHKLPDIVSIPVTVFSKSRFPLKCYIKNDNPYHLVQNCLYDDHDDIYAPKCPPPPYKNKNNTNVTILLKPDEFINRFKNIEKFTVLDLICKIIDK
jgi:hypothetical protein